LLYIKVTYTSAENKEKSLQFHSNFFLYIFKLLSIMMHNNFPKKNKKVVSPLPLEALDLMEKLNVSQKKKKTILGKKKK
jgi:hypothetical protein